MARVQRPGDRLERLDGDGVLLTVDLVRDALARLRTLAPASPGH
jgi:hypothetical protein